MDKTTMKRMPQPIPYQGSKRSIAKYILHYFPKHIDNFYEPFAGSAAITVASAFNQKANHYLLNDIDQPLMNLWKQIILFIVSLFVFSLLKI